MKITVLHGSPKGEKSVTAQYVRYLEKCFPEHSFTIYCVAQEIARLENDADAFRAVIDAVADADAVLWSFPLYFLLLPAQLKRFLELVNERGAQAAFAGKYTTALTTSVHFYDHTAHAYLHAACEDWGMHYCAGYSAEMHDLLKPEEQQKLRRFARVFLTCAVERRPVPRRFAPLDDRAPAYRSARLMSIPKDSPGYIALVTDAREEDVSLRAMIDDFIAASPNPVEVIDLHELDMRGGCLGCLRCGYDGHCVYRDAVETTYRERIFPAEATVYALRIVDRHVSARFKTFLDRRFFNGHRPIMEVKQLGFLISGPVRQMPELRQFCEAQAQVGHHSALCHIVTDEDDAPTVTANLAGMARQLAQDITEHAQLPATFLGVGGMLLFRDLVYRLRSVFHADYLYYRRHGLLRYPQHELGQRAVNAFLALLLRIPRFRRGFARQSTTFMIKPFQQVVERAGGVE